MVQLVVLVATAVILGGCSATGPLVLPVLRVPGRLPRQGEILRIDLLPDGRVECDGEEMDLDALKKCAASFADSSGREGTAYRPGGGTTVLRCDRRAVFGDLEPVLAVLHDPEVRLYKVFYVVRLAGEEGDRGFAWFLPDGADDDLPLPTFNTIVEVRCSGETKSDAAGLYRALAERRKALLDKEEHHNEGVIFVVDAEVSVGVLLRVAEVANLVGFRFALPLSARAWQARRRAEGREGGGGTAIYLNGQFVGTGRGMETGDTGRRGEGGIRGYLTPFQETDVALLHALGWLP